MGRKPNPNKAKRLPLTLIEATLKRLQMLVNTGAYGNNPTEAARMIIAQHLRDLDEKKKIDIFVPPTETPKGDNG